MPLFLSTSLLLLSLNISPLSSTHLSQTPALRTLLKQLKTLRIEEGSLKGTQMYFLYVLTSNNYCGLRLHNLLYIWFLLCLIITVWVGITGLACNIYTYHWPKSIHSMHLGDCITFPQANITVTTLLSQCLDLCSYVFFLSLDFTSDDSREQWVQLSFHNDCHIHSES